MRPIICGAVDCSRWAEYTTETRSGNRLYRCAAGHITSVTTRTSTESERVRNGLDESAQKRALWESFEETVTNRFGAEAYARRDDPDTSQQAAATVDANERERQALDGLRQCGGRATVKEIANAAGVHEWSISPRMAPLERKGMVRRTKERRGRSIVWEMASSA